MYHGGATILKSAYSFKKIPGVFRLFSARKKIIFGTRPDFLTATFYFSWTLTISRYGIWKKGSEVAKKEWKTAENLFLRSLDYFKP
jgi:hypothetical protein